MSVTVHSSSIEFSDEAKRNSHILGLISRKRGLYGIEEPINLDDWLIHGNSVVHRNVYVHPLATIGSECVIEHHAIIGEGTRISNDCYISAHANVHTSCDIGVSVNVGPYSHIYHQTTIGSMCNLGKGCWIGHHARVGHGVSIGQGADIRHHVVIDDYCDIGVSAGIGEYARIYYTTIPSHSDIPSDALIPCTPLLIGSQLNLYSMAPHEYNVLHIGCQKHSIDFWRKNLDEIADEHGVPANTMPLYRALIEAYAAWFEVHKADYAKYMKIPSA
jgi:NDP-sugar pyrophosphorylase family protein